MPNRNYLKGVRKERKLVNQAREQGLVSFRSAGSHSPVDVIIISPVDKVIRLIQCKPDSMGEKARGRIESENIALNGVFAVSFEVI